MSTYYEYREVKVMIAHRLMSMEGWKVYGYREDQSDSMTDYYCPASWGGIAEKNGYILVVDNDRKVGPEEIKKRNQTDFVVDNSTREKISKLEEITVERGASVHEEKTAKEKIELLKSKNINNSDKPNFVVIGVIPAHEANPPRCNWHAEKDGIIILKGTGLLKFADIPFDVKNNHEYNYKVDVEALTLDYLNRGIYSEREKAYKAALRHKENMDEKKKLSDQFDALIHKIDTACGGILGEGDLVIYDKIIVTEYKTENKAVEGDGCLKEGQHFIVKSSGFNYGVNKGYVYVIHEHTGTNNEPYFTANRLDGKLKKELTGKANPANNWGYITAKSKVDFLKWIDKGVLAYCNIVEVKTPYEVEKVVKKEINATAKKPGQTEPHPTKSEHKGIFNLLYEITEDVDTRFDSKIFLVRIKDKLERDDYLRVNSFLVSKGGYYSKFKHAFLFKEDPKHLLIA